LGTGTCLASGGEEREGWERILARSCMHGSVFLFSLFSLNFSNIAGAWVLLGVVLVNLLGIGARFLVEKGFAPK
jgi:hypothetical protein